MQKQLEPIKLISGDRPLIAKLLGVSLVTVADTLGKRRGKRPTIIQMKIKMAAEFFEQKNKEKADYCVQLNREFDR